MTLQEKARVMAIADFTANGCYVNSPYTVLDNAGRFIAKAVFNKQFDKWELRIVHPERVHSTVEL